MTIPGVAGLEPLKVAIIFEGRRGDEYFVVSAVEVSFATLAGHAAFPLDALDAIQEGDVFAVFPKYVSAVPRRG